MPVGLIGNAVRSGANVLQSEKDLDMTWETKAIPNPVQDWKGSVYAA